ncbi:MAG: M28 family metallopeptidase [Defluviitaleaceae bacterium]|nr:M28 family metallopeptidase [Defluviitaleaceae bacterium]
MEFILAFFMLFTGGNYAVTPDYEAVQNQPAIAIYEEAEETSVYDTVFDLTQIINTLAAPELRGRLVGTAENEQAVEYTSAIFESLGLTPFGTNGFLHAYEQEVFNPDYSNARLTVTFTDGTARELQLGSEFLFRTCTVPADVIFTLDSDGTWINNIPESGWQLRASANHMVVPGRSGLVENGVVVENPITGAWPPATHVSLYQELYDELMEIGIKEMHFRADDTGRIATVHNVIGILEGRDSSRAVVLTAHLDGPGFMGDMHSDGANDNVSGVAAIIYAAYILAQHQDELEVDVVFAALNGEESGLIGAFALVPELIERYTELYNLNFDGIGSTGLDAYFILGEEDHDSYLLSAFMELMTEYGLTYQDMIISLAMGGIADHAVFLYHDIPAVSMIQSYRIHTVYDTVERLDIDEIKLVGRMIAEFILNSGTEMYLRNAS